VLMPTAAPGGTGIDSVVELTLTPSVGQRRRACVLCGDLSSGINHGVPTGVPASYRGGTSERVGQCHSVASYAQNSFWVDCRAPARLSRCARYPMLAGRAAGGSTAFLMGRVRSEGAAMVVRGVSWTGAVRRVLLRALRLPPRLCAR
jgi:hypothetical protein